MLNANTGLCSQERPNFSNSRSKLCLAHAQKKFVEVVVYLKISSSSTLTSVESFMLVSGIAQSWLSVSLHICAGKVTRQCDKYQAILC